MLQTTCFAISVCQSCKTPFQFPNSHLIRHRNVRYNCRVFVLNRKLLLIRPKKVLADDGNYRESRWFTAWKLHFQIQDYYLPRIISSITGTFLLFSSLTAAIGQTKVPIGDACIATRDTVLASETCEELFAPASPHIALGLNGIEIISNGSGSHHQLRKLYQRVSNEISVKFLRKL